MALLLRWLSSQASFGDEPNIWNKQFSAAETLGALAVRFLEEVDADSIVEDISVCSSSLLRVCNQYWGAKTLEFFV